MVFMWQAGKKPHGKHQIGLGARRKRRLALRIVHACYRRSCAAMRGIAHFLPASGCRISKIELHGASKDHERWPSLQEKGCRDHHFGFAWGIEDVVLQVRSFFPAQNPDFPTFVGQKPIGVRLGLRLKADTVAACHASA
jgi:hypothetical protein